MKNLLLKRVISNVFFLIVLGLTSGCSWITMEEEQQTVLDERSYSINPTGLLQSLSQGRKDVFLLRKATPAATAYWSSSKVTWTQSDYYKIAQSFHQFASGQSFDGWELEKMSFTTQCENVDVGLQEGGFTLFKTEHVGEKVSRLVHFIFISSRREVVDFSSAEEIYQSFGEYPSLDISNIKITADQALKIAEGAGGFNIREDIKNRCSVLIRIDAINNPKGWYVAYSPDNVQTPSFRVIVNATTGDFEIIR